MVQSLFASLVTSNSELAQLWKAYKAKPQNKILGTTEGTEETDELEASGPAVVVVPDKPKGRLRKRNNTEWRAGMADSDSDDQDEDGGRERDEDVSGSVHGSAFAVDKTNTWTQRRLEVLSVTELRKMCTDRSISISKQAQRKTCVRLLLDWKLEEQQ
jgi:hypothetical protein